MGTPFQTGQARYLATDVVDFLECGHLAASQLGEFDPGFRLTEAEVAQLEPVFQEEYRFSDRCAPLRMRADGLMPAGLSDLGMSGASYVFAA